MALKVGDPVIVDGIGIREDFKGKSGTIVRYVANDEWVVLVDGVEHYFWGDTLKGWEAGIPCPECKGPTLAPRPDHDEEVGDYCEACGTARDESGKILL